MPRAGDGPIDGAGRRVFFLHVMKTGGTTLSAQIRRNFDPSEVYPDPAVDPRGTNNLRPFMIRYLCRLPESRRRVIQVYVGHFPYVAAQLLGDDFMTVTILRDPVDRIISLLGQLRRGAAWRGLNVPHDTASRTLEEIYEMPDVYEPLAHNHQTKMFSLTVDDAPPSYMHVIDIDDERLAIAKQNLSRVDVLGLTERYEDFLREVADRLGWQVKMSARLNESGPDTEGNVSSAFRRRLADDNAFDRELYEHARMLVDSRAHTR